MGEGARLTIGRENELKAEQRAQLERGRLTGLAPLESWTATGTNHENAYATHGLFRYFGKFPPPVAAHLIESYTRAGELVFDPMCGSGTTGVECLLRNRRCELRDVSPLSLLLARVKTRRMARRRLNEAMARIQSCYRPREGGFEPVGLRNPDHWFLPQTARSLRGLRQAVEREQNGTRDVFRTVFAATVRRVSRATTQQGRLFLDADTALEDAWPTFERRAKAALRTIPELPGGGQRVRVAHHDLRERIGSPSQAKAALVIVHPPYFNAYRYSRINSLELAWLGCDQVGVRKTEVREFFKVGKPENVERYIDDMELSLANAVRLVRPGGVLAMMNGDTILRGEHLPVVRPLMDRLCAHGLSVERIAIRVPRYSEASWVASQRRRGNQLGVPLRDYVVVFRKEAA